MAGRFITKWEIVCGMVRMVGGGGGRAGSPAAVRDRFSLEGMLILLLFVAVRVRSSEAQSWMNLWPSEQWAWTKFWTCKCQILSSRDG